VEIKGKGREMMPVEGAYHSRENETAYQGLFESQQAGLGLENTFFWNRSLRPATD
jgi:hypothetical protein